MTQVIRYAAIGALVNAGGYLLYLFLVSLTMGPKLSASLLYLLGAAASFVANRHWTFSHSGAGHKALFRFTLAHIGGYLINMLLIWWFVDVLGMMHEWIEAAAILIVAGYLFVVSRTYVFAREAL